MGSRVSAVQALGLWLLLSCSHISPAQAHAGEASGHHGSTDKTMEKDLKPGLPSYFSLSDHAGLLYTHVVLMTIAWVVVLPVAVMLSIVASRYTLVTQTVFIAINILGLLTVLSYNDRTPDLYPNNAHHKIGWIITNIVTIQVILGVIARRRSSHASLDRQESADVQPFMALPTMPDHRGCIDESQDFQHSDDANWQSSIELLEHQSRISETTQVECWDDEPELPPSVKFGNSGHARSNGCFSAFTRPLKSILRAITSISLWEYVRFAYKIIDRIILPFGFIAFATGVVAMGRFFEGGNFLNGLAHWIKGGVFFWFGLLNLGRWAGSFADLGWAWNIRPQKSNDKAPPSAEFVESFLIFIYGSTNIFLEHLSNTDGKWTARDLEHIAITVLFIGGGLCGMLIESASIRDLLNTTVHASGSCRSKQQMRAPASYGCSLNPIPALVICLLGIIMGSHHQASMTSTMVHKQWGNLLFGASFARCLTYILMYIRPPTSILPSRPPTELLASFGLIAGGIVFMASSKDTVDGMARNGLDAMFLYTVTMGLVGILMAWEVVVLALKGLAVRLENRHAFRR